MKRKRSKDKFHKTIHMSDSLLHIILYLAQAIIDRKWFRFIDCLTTSESEERLKQVRIILPFVR